VDVEANVGRLTSAARIVVNAAKIYQRHEVPRLSAALAYYAAFSLAPILVIAIAISGVVFGPEAARGEVFGQLEGVLGISGASALQAMVISASKPAPGAIAAAQESKSISRTSCRSPRPSSISAASSCRLRSSRRSSH
jgi:membrane protein